jgi:hypothetical protein
VLVNLDDVDISTAWETIRDNVKISAKDSLRYYEWKPHKPWFDKGCSKLLDQRNHAELQLLQDASQINWDKLNTVRRDAS